MSEPQEAKNPLLGSIPSVYASFEEWKADWDKTNSWSGKLSLLYFLTTEKGWWWDGREKLVSLLLDVADGHWDVSNFTIRDEGHGGNTGHEYARRRQTIAEKAFGVLCARVFKNTDRDGATSWMWILTNEGLFSKVLWFLRPGSNNYNDYSRTHGDANGVHQQEVLYTFMRTLARLGWEFRSVSDRHSDEKVDEPVRKRLIAARPQLIEMLYQIGELDWLNYKELDTACVEKLTEMALSGFGSFRSDEGDRKPRGVEEAAAFCASVPAMIVLVHRVREGQRRRLAARMREARRREEIARRQRELAEIEAQKGELQRRATELARGR